jgi:L-seryl-tRNA(Ser) seleniumtransferase
VIPAVNEPSPVDFRLLPAVCSVLEHSGVRPLLDEHGRKVVVGWTRDELDRARGELRNGGLKADRHQLLDQIADRLIARAQLSVRDRVGRVINATGVILHTGLGRAALSQAAQTAICEIAGAGNIEVDLESGERRYRGYQLQPAWSTLTGCEASLIVNNNAAATLLTLQALCWGREVIISRGQLIEIGGSFRLPDIFELSGAKLCEVGTTNRTRLTDYERAIGPETAAIMHVHPSNYRIIGFTETPGIAPLAELARARGLTAIDDIGSGALLDVTRYGLPAEPTFGESIAAGADVVLGSGDKLLGGPQAGIILGRSEIVKSVRSHPLARTVRVGKLTLAALSATLDSYLRGTAVTEIPTLRLLSADIDDLLERARSLKKDVGESDQMVIEVGQDVSPVGGGSLPGAELPTAIVSLRHRGLSADELARKLRLGTIHVYPRIQQDRVIVDLRSVLPEDDSKIALALRLAAGHQPE